MHLHVLSLRHTWRLGVEDRAQEGVASSSLMFGENSVRLQQHRPHLVGDRFERIAQNFERDLAPYVFGSIGRIVHRPISSLTPWG